MTSSVTPSVRTYSRVESCTSRMSCNRRAMASGSAAMNAAGVAAGGGVLGTPLALGRPTPPAFGAWPRR